MAEFAAVAGAVVGVAEFVGVVGNASWRSSGGTQPGTRAIAPDAFSGRDEHHPGIGREGSC